MKHFLQKIKKKQVLQLLPSGLQYEVIKMGTGPKPTAESTVKVHYVGTLIDGTEFDSSVKRNEPAQFPVSGVIPGWTEALTAYACWFKIQTLSSSVNCLWSNWCR